MNGKNYEKEHAAYWRGFNLAIQVVFQVLETMEEEFDFTCCTSGTQICENVRAHIEEEIEYMKKGE